MDLNRLKSFLGEDWTRVEARIGEQLRSDIEVLNMTNSRILEHSGKQLRPLLALLVARACSGGRLTDAGISYAAAAELLHNATLLHDDVADSSDQRRGVPTIRSLMGPSVSVLVGDFWLVRAMECILGCDTPLDGRVIRLFSRTLSDLAREEPRLPFRGGRRVSSHFSERIAGAGAGCAGLCGLPGNGVPDKG